MKRGYYVAGKGEESGFAVVAASAKDAKKIVFDSGELDVAWVDIRVYWRKDAMVEHYPIGMVSDWRDGLILGLYSYIEEAPCDRCGNDRTLHEHQGGALCGNCIKYLESRDPQNAIIERLKLGPCTAKELPYRKGGMGKQNRRRFLSINVCGKRTNNCARCGLFTTVYYLPDDVDAAVKLFVELNAESLSRVNFSTNSMLDGGLPKHLAQKIRGAVRKDQST